MIGRLREWWKHGDERLFAFASSSLENFRDYSAWTVAFAAGLMFIFMAVMSVIGLGVPLFGSSFVIVFFTMGVAVVIWAFVWSRRKLAGMAA